MRCKAEATILKSPISKTETTRQKYYQASAVNQYIFNKNTK
ncbi:hypothetical protein HMPREF3034_01837 [Prevotella sp. DNF00663]|nr:hypothetical protein HMPREF3034_01837 [Prevotella sp. DNF00663]